jgi:peroxiredoxin
MNKRLNGNLTLPDQGTCRCNVDILWYPQPNFKFKMNFISSMLSNGFKRSSSQGDSDLLSLSRKVVFLLLFGFILSGVAGYSQTKQSGSAIHIHISGLHYDSLWFGPMYGRTASPDYAAKWDSDSLFTFTIPDSLPEGLYGIILRKSAGSRPDYFPFWITAHERSFTIKTSINGFYSKATITGSPENEQYFYYQHQYDLVGKNLATAIENWKLLPDAASWRSLLLAEKTFSIFQKTFLLKHPGSLTSAIVAKTMLLLPPPGLLPEDYAEAGPMRFQWQKDHFFDQMDLHAAEILGSPLYLDKLDYYLLMLPPPEPDTVIRMLDQLFLRLEKNPEVYQYYLRYLIQLTETLSRHRMDEVFIHLVHAYLDQEKLTLISAEHKERLRLSADRLSRIVTGSLAPNLTLKKESGDPVTLHAVEADWLLVVFWLPDCAHCKRELPEIKRLTQKYAGEGLKILSVCGKSGSMAKDCWHFARKESLPMEWILTNDPDRQSRFSSLFNVRSYPTIFLLDKNKRIQYKQIGATPPFSLDRALLKAIGK